MRGVFSPTTWVLACTVAAGCAQDRAALDRAAATAAGTGAWSMLQVCFLASASETFFLSRMSSRSGEERSGRKGTKTGALAGLEPAFFAGLACLGCGACIAGAAAPDVGVASVAADGSDLGYCDGGVGLGSSPEVLVKGWTARGSKDARTEWDMVVWRRVGVADTWYCVGWGDAQ